MIRSSGNSYPNYCFWIFRNHSGSKIPEGLTCFESTSLETVCIEGCACDFTSHVPYSLSVKKDGIIYLGFTITQSLGCAVRCTNRFAKGGGMSFYRFLKDPARRAMWIGAVRRKNWMPNKHTWICREHFISEEKSDNPLSIGYVPTWFAHISPI